MPGDEEDEDGVDRDEDVVEDDGGDDDGGNDDGDEGSDADRHPTTGQRLIPLPRRPPPQPTNGPPARATRPARPAVDAARRPRPRRPKAPENATPEPAATQPVNQPPPLPQTAPPAPTVPTAPARTAHDGNVLLSFEETLKVYPSANATISVERRTGVPAQWMVTTRPRTANELYEALKALHGRSGEATYEVAFRDGAGHGSGGSVSLPSTLDAPPAPGQPVVRQEYPYPSQVAYAQPQPASHYAPPAPAPQVAPSGTPFEVMLAMQKQVFDMVQSMAPKPVAAPPAAPAPPAQPPPPAAPDINALLAMQKQMFDMVQSMQPGHAQPPPPPQPQPAPASPQSAGPVDQTAALLAMQKQMFDMMQAMQATAAGHTPPTSPQPTPAAPATDPTGVMLAMQKQTFDMMLQMMQATQRGSAPPPGGGPYTGPYRPRDPRDGGASGAPATPYASPHYQSPQRPQTPSEQLRDAANVFRSTMEVAREFGFAGQTAEPAATSVEEDDTPVRVIDMGLAKGVINRDDGRLRGVETFMANLPDILKWVGDQRAEIRKEREASRQRDLQQQLPPGYVVATPDYQPPPGFVAVPVDQIPQAAQETLPEAPEEMPPPLAAEKPRSTWGMPPTRSG
jgi:hypothetical protein